MPAAPKPNKVKIEDVRLAFPSLWEKAMFRGETTGKAKFQATFLFPKEHPALAKLTQALNEVGQRKWGEKWAELKASMKANKKLCLRNGDDHPDYDGFPGNFFLRCSADVKPTVLDKDAMTPLTAQDGRPFGGCYVDAVVELWAQDNQYGKRINGTVKGVMFRRMGDAFGAGPPASPDEFSAAEDLGVEEGELETVGADDDPI